MQKKSTKSVQEMHNPVLKSSVFPPERYFQIHFEYITELIVELKESMDESNEKIQSIQYQIDLLQ